jgi:hypothetical protein
MAAYNLEVGGKATVTAVLRSNFAAVQNNGFSIDSIDHGKVEGWRPTESMYLSVQIVSCPLGWIISCLYLRYLYMKMQR